MELAECQSGGFGVRRDGMTRPLWRCASILIANPHDSTVLFFLAGTYRCKGMEAEATKTWEDALVASGNQADAASIRRAFARGGYGAVLLGIYRR